MIDDQTAAFHMKDLHACARHVDEDEHADILQVETHLVGDDAAQRVEVLAYVRRMRIQEEPVVGVRQAEHPLSPYHYQLAERMCGDLSRQADSHDVGKDDFADRMSHFHRVYPLSAGSFFFEPQSYSGEVMKKRRGSPNAYLSDRRKTFFRSLGLSALAGYETSNWGRQAAAGRGYAAGQGIFHLRRCAHAGTGNLLDRPGGVARQCEWTDAVRLGHRQVPHVGRHGTEIHYQLTAI